MLWSLEENRNRSSHPPEQGSDMNEQWAAGNSRCLPATLNHRLVDQAQLNRQNLMPRVLEIPSFERLWLRSHRGPASENTPFSDGGENARPPRVCPKYSPYGPL